MPALSFRGRYSSRRAEVRSAYLLLLPVLVFFLLFITQLNDVLQYCWGKAFGRTKITPKVSPNKTWEGAIGGWVTTAAVLSVALVAAVRTPIQRASGLQRR